jgi:hypothetical protein
MPYVAVVSFFFSSFFISLFLLGQKFAQVVVVADFNNLSVIDFGSRKLFSGHILLLLPFCSWYNYSDLVFCMEVKILLCLYLLLLRHITACSELLSSVDWHLTCSKSVIKALINKCLALFKKIEKEMSRVTTKPTYCACDL